MSALTATAAHPRRLIELDFVWLLCVLLGIAGMLAVAIARVAVNFPFV